MVIPPRSLSEAMVAEIIQKTKQLAKELKIKGLMNVQYAIKDSVLHCLEVNPRASRTIPFVSKAIGVALGRHAACVMVGERLKKLGFVREVVPGHISVKESVFPFIKFPGVDIILSPEMKSTGEVMGIDDNFGRAYFKSQDSAWCRLPDKGKIFISVKDSDKERVIGAARALVELGFELVATSGTKAALEKHGIPVETVKKIAEGRPNVADLIRSQEIKLIIVTPKGKGPALDEGKIRSLAVTYEIPCITTVKAAYAAVDGMNAYRQSGITVKALQDYHEVLQKASAGFSPAKNRGGSASLFGRKDLAADHV